MDPKLAIALLANLPDCAGDSPIAQPDADRLSTAAAVQAAYRQGTSQPQPGALTIPSGSGMNYTGQNESLREHPGGVLVTWGYGIWGERVLQKENAIFLTQVENLIVGDPRKPESPGWRKQAAIGWSRHS
jgi:hypothetical protein